jgi:dihydroorotase
MSTLLLRSATLVTDHVSVSDILIEGSTIHSITPTKSHPTPPPHGAEVIDAKGLLCLPMLIDCHVHFREPGLTHKATMASESASALAGGVGTVCEMPNTIPPTVTIAALADKVRRAADIPGIRILFFFGITEATHLQTLRELWTSSSYEVRRLKSHCCGVKLYLDHSTGDQKVDGGIVEEIFKTCAELRIPLVAHCEDAEMNQKLVKAKNASDRDVSVHSRLRPPESEAKAIKEAITFAEKHRTALHIAHLSTFQGIDLVRDAKRRKVPVTCEVSPHHLFLTVDDYGVLGSLGKMNPPLRTAEHRDALWAGIADGTVDCVATDHAPHTLEEKGGNEPLSAPSGVPGVETMLPLLLTVATGSWPHPSTKRPNVCGTFSPSDIVRLCCTNPHRIFSLGEKGIVDGSPARMMLLDPKEKRILRGADMRILCKWTPFERWEVCGKIVRQWND